MPCNPVKLGDGDLCRAHAPLWDAALARPKVGPGAEEAGKLGPQ